MAPSLSPLPVPAKAVEAALGPLPSPGGYGDGSEVSKGFEAAMQLVTEEMPAALAAARPFLMEARFRVLIPPLIEASRCLGSYQEKGDKDAIAYWDKQVLDLQEQIRKEFQGD